MIDNSEQLKRIRKERGLTIQAVCDGADIPIRTYQNYEYGKREISAEALYKLANFYGVSTDYLLGREKDPEPMEQLANQMSMQEMEADIFGRWLKLSPKEREIILNVLRDIVRKDDAKLKKG